jgi:hypothetical protein
MGGEDAQRSAQSLSLSFDAVSSVHSQTQNYSHQGSLFCSTPPFATLAVSTLGHGVSSICYSHPVPSRRSLPA